jgi:putative nucleotidyltransferase with HDIG domain
LSLTLSEIQRKTLAILEARIDQVALLPSDVSKLSKIDIDSVDATEEIESLIRSDPPLALRLMRLASAGGIATNNVATIKQALIQVGSKRLADMILALSIVEVFVPSTQAQRNLWIHSIQTAFSARRIAELKTDLHINPEEAYLAGLIHDIGRFMIFEHNPQNIALVDEALVTDPLELVQAEIEVCGFDHATLGGVICERLLLPFGVCEMTRTHHFYRNKRAQIAPEVETLVRVVQEADCLSFGLLRSASRPWREPINENWIPEALELIVPSERFLASERWTEEVRNIHHDARLAAAVVDIAYPAIAPKRSSLKSH